MENVKSGKARTVAQMFPMHITPDPTQPINDFLWSLAKARSLGFTPSSAHMMAEHFLRGDVSLVFYSSAGGTIALAADDAALDNDDSFEVLKFVMERVAARRKAKGAPAAEGDKEDDLEKRADLEAKVERYKLPTQRAALGKVKQQLARMDGNA